MSGKSAKDKRPSIDPKKPTTGYVVFSTQFGKMIREKNPELKFAEVSKIVSENWNKLSDEQKEPFNTKSEEDKKRYENEMASLNKKGFFITVDGQDSRDLYKAPRGGAKVSAQKPSAEPPTFPQNSKKGTSQSPSKATPQAQPKSAPSRTVKTKEAPQAVDTSKLIKPKRTCSAYIQFTMRTISKVRDENPDMKDQDCMKKCAEIWNSYTDEQKKPFVKFQEEDEKRYQKEQQQFEKNGWFTNSDGIKSTDLKTNLREKDFPDGTVFPKKASSSYMQFNKEMNPKIQKELNTTNIALCAKKSGEKWNALTDKQKKKYELLAAKDKERYEAEFNQLKTKGFFVNADGVKSTDLSPKKKRAKKE